MTANDPKMLGRTRAVGERVRALAEEGVSVADLLRLVQQEYGTDGGRLEAMAAFRAAFGLHLDDVLVIGAWAGWNIPGCTLDDAGVSKELAPKIQVALKAQK